MSTVRMTLDELRDAIAKKQGFQDLQLVVVTGKGILFGVRSGVPEVVPDYPGSIDAAMSLIPSEDGERVVLSRIRANVRTPWRGQMIWHCSFRDYSEGEHPQLPVAICLAYYRKEIGEGELIE